MGVLTTSSSTKQLLLHRLKCKPTISRLIANLDRLTYPNLNRLIYRPSCQVTWATMCPIREESTVVLVCLRDTGDSILKNCK